MRVGGCVLEPFLELLYSTEEGKWKGGLWGGSGVEASRMPSRMPYPSPIAIFFRFNGIDQHRFTAAGSADRAHDAAKEHKKDEEPS